MPKRKSKPKAKYFAKNFAVAKAHAEIDLTSIEFPKFDGFDNNATLINEADKKRNEWLDKRRKYFTASKAGAIMSFDYTDDEISQLKTERESILTQIAESKTGKTKTLESKLAVIDRKIKSSEELPKGAVSVAMGVVIGRLTKFNELRQKPVKTPSIAWGNACEVEAIEYFSKITGFSVSKTGENQEFVECKIHPELDGFVGCTPDGIIVFCNGGISGVEIKCPESINHLDNLKIRSRDDLLNMRPEYYWQIMFQMLCTGAEFWYFASYDPDFIDDGKKMVFLQIARDNDAIERLKKRLYRLIDFVKDNT